MPTPNPTFPLSRDGSSSSHSSSDSSGASTSSSSSSPSTSSSSSDFPYFKTPSEVSAFVRSLSGKQLAATAAAVVATPLAIGGAWWLFEHSFNSVTPYQYHYRPGTISAFFSRALARHASRRRLRAPVRVYMDGCFDMMHYGHANALRQAKALGDVLVVGLIPDSQIRKYKGPPVMDEAERKTMVESLKWVDEVLTDVPYELTPEFLHELFTRHRIDVVVHGDDPCLLPDGTDAYAHAKAQGRFRVIKRTEGVSSTDIVGRMLMCTPARGALAGGGGGMGGMGVGGTGGGGLGGDGLKNRDGRKDFCYPAEALAKQFSAGDPEALAMLGSSPPSTSTGAAAAAEAAKARERERSRPSAEAPREGVEGASSAAAALSSSSSSAAAAAAAETATTAADANASPPSEPSLVPRGAPPTAVSRFLPTTRRIVQFSAGAAAARPGDRVVYLDGAFDLFHPGHVAALRAARSLGDFLLVGVHSDEDVRLRRGAGRPIMDLHERALSVLACRFVNEVVIGAPAVLTEDLLTTFNVSVVARGTTTEMTPTPAMMMMTMPPHQRGRGGGGGMAGSALSNDNSSRLSSLLRKQSFPSATSLSAPPSRVPSPIPVGVLEALGAPCSPKKSEGGEGRGGEDAFDDGDDDASTSPPSAAEAAAVAAAAAAEVAAAAAATTTSESRPSSSSSENNNNNNNNGLPDPSSSPSPSLYLSDERRYAVARAKGIFVEFRSPSTLTAAAVVDRIVANRALYERRNAKKAAAEATYYREAKTYVAEK